MRQRAYQRVGPGKRARIATFDFETDGLGGPPLAATFMMEGHSGAHWLEGADCAQELFLIMCENNEYEWFAHNAQYDLRYLIELLKHDMDNLQIYLRTDTDVFMIVLKLPEYGEDKTLVIKDSFALYPESLKAFSNQFCPEMPKLELDLENVRFDPKNKQHRDYALRDAEALLLSIIRFDDLIFKTFDVHIKATAASTAVAAWQRTLKKGEYYARPSGYDDFIRSAYYGGLVFITDTNPVENANTYDLNSSYPYNLMVNDFPIGNPIRTSYFRPSFPGVYAVTVKAPDGVIVPILPKRDDKGIVWPSGIFDTTCTSVDLQFALDHGYRLLSVNEGLFWEKTCSPFRAFVEKCRSIRFAHKGTALEKVAKLMQNSLYGKFGTKKIRKKIYASLPEDEQLGCEVWGDFFIRDELDETMLSLPQWAAFCTAYARRLLLSHVYEHGPINAVYGDTDSITFRSNCKPETGPDYGQLKLEKTWTIFRARAPKVYAGIRQDTGEIAGAIKGIPRKKWESSGALNMVYSGSGGVINYQTLPKFIRILKGEKGNLYDASRSISHLSKSRSWKLQGDGTVRPRSWAEIEKATPVRQRDSAPAFDEFGVDEITSLFG